MSVTISLKEYWKDMTYSINNEGIVCIYKGDTLMGLTTKDSIKFNNINCFRR